jgi:hypothetical protein
MQASLMEDGIRRVMLFLAIRDKSVKRGLFF